VAEQSTSTPGQSVLDWLRAGYPEGIPPQDYVPILGVLQRRLTSAEIHTISEGLAEQLRHTDDTITRADIEAMIEDTVYQRALASDVARVSARLAAGGWPLADPHSA
jgi:Protein of unknown function (DUF3349)